MAKIITDYGVKGELTKQFNCSYITVRRALNGDTHTTQARNIRAAAIKRGGVETRN